MSKPTKGGRVKRFSLHEEVARLAKGQKPISAMTQRDILDWAARSLRAQQRAMIAALKAAGLPKTANVELQLVIVGQALKDADDIRRLEELFRLPDPR